MAWTQRQKNKNQEKTTTQEPGCGAQGGRRCRGFVGAIDGTYREATRDEKPQAQTASKQKTDTTKNTKKGTQEWRRKGKRRRGGQQGAKGPHGQPGNVDGQLRVLAVAHGKFGATFFWRRCHAVLSTSFTHSRAHGGVLLSPPRVPSYLQLSLPTVCVREYSENAAQPTDRPTDVGCSGSRRCKHGAGRLTDSAFCSLN